MIYNFLNIEKKLQRKHQISLLKKHPKVDLKSIKLGFDNYFVLYPKFTRISIGIQVTFRNFIHVIVHNNATLEIGNQVFMNNFCSINCLDFISIGDNTLFGENVKLYDHNHAYTRHENTLQISQSDFNKAPIKIGKNCWLGSNVTVLKGVTIGDNCIIGAGCVIYKNIPENTTVTNKQNLMFESN